MPSSPGPVGSTGMAFRMTIGRSRPWPGYPRHTGLVSASCTSNPRFRHRLSSDPASRRAPLLRRMVPVITVHRGLAPAECISLLDTPGESACPHRWREPSRNVETPATGQEASYSGRNRIIFSHASAPPSNGRTRVMPWDLSSSATRALEASFGQVQKRMISRSRGICCELAVRSSAENRMAPGTELASVSCPPRKSTM
jgi:hypothetical protein